MRKKQHRIPPEKTARARELRQDASFPERLLWSRLRRDQLAGLRFRRQHVIGHYIVDFYCAAAKLVVELDGRTHEGRRVASDRMRTAFLESQGLRVIRYSNDDVLEDVGGVADSIARLAGAVESQIEVRQPVDPPLQRNPPPTPP